MAEVNVKIKAQNQTRTGFQQALGDAQRFGTSASSSLRSSFAGVASDIKSSIGGALMGLASIGAIRNIMDQFGRLSDLSQQFGVSAETLQRFGQVASESGSSMEQVATAFSKLTVNIQKAQGGTGAQADALRELGLSAKELSSLSPEQAFLKLADAVASSTDYNKAYAAATDLIGNRQRDLIPLLAQGADAIRAQAESVNAASDEIVAKVDEIGDRFGRIGQQITVGLGPAIAFIGQAFLSAFAVVEAVVTKLASSITSSFAAAGQALSGDFAAAGETMRGEASATTEQWDTLKKKIEEINSASAKAPKPARGAEDDEDQGASSAGGRSSKSNIQQQIRDQQTANARANMEDEARLLSLKREKGGIENKFGGTSAEDELKVLQITGQIDALQRQISDRKKQDADRAAQDAAREAAQAAKQRQDSIKSISQEMEGRAFGALSPAEQAAQIARDQATLLSDIEGGNITDAEAAQRAMELARRQDSLANGGFQGSSGASAFQRVGLATNEFFDTRKAKDPAEGIAKGNILLGQIKDALSKAEPLVLNPSSS